MELAATIEGLNLLVTDLTMPKMNGDELARRLRVLQPDLPVLYLTGFSDRLFADRMQLWENEAFLDKPCSINGLLEAMSLVSHRPVPGAFGVRPRAKAAIADAASTDARTRAEKPVADWDRKDGGPREARTRDLRVANAPTARHTKRTIHKG